MEGIEYYAYETVCLEGTFQWHNTSRAQDITRTSATIAHILIFYLLTRRKRVILSLFEIAELNNHCW